jgi:hypothetical protein
LIILSISWEASFSIDYIGLSTFKRPPLVPGKTWVHRGLQPCTWTR